MNKIKTIKDARALAELFTIEHPEANPNMATHYCIGYGTEKNCIQLFDSIKENRLMIYIEQNQNDDTHLVYFTDTVNGTEFCQWLTLSEIEEAIWHNRKFINQSGQLADL